MDKLPFSVYDFFGYLSSGFVVLVGLAAAFAGTDSWQHTPSTVVALVLVVLAYSTGQVVANIAGWLLEASLVRRFLGTPTTNLFADAKPKVRSFFLPGYYNPLPKTQRDLCLSKAGLDGPSEALFYRCFGKVKSNEAVMGRLSTFLNLYGFCRNMAVSFMIVGFALIGGAANSSAHTGVVIPPGWWAAVCFVGAIGLTYRYLKFFRHYSVEVFISYAETP